MSSLNLYTICVNSVKWHPFACNFDEETKDFKFPSDSAGEDESLFDSTKNLHVNSELAPISVTDENTMKATDVVTAYLNPMKFDPYHVSYLFVGDSKELKFPSRDEDLIDEHAKTTEDQAVLVNTGPIGCEGGSNLFGAPESKKTSKSPGEQSQVFKLDESDEVPDTDFVNAAVTENLYVGSEVKQNILADKKPIQSSEEVTMYLNPMKYDPYHVSCMFIGDSKELKFPSREDDILDQHVNPVEDSPLSVKNVQVDCESGSMVFGDADSSKHADSPKEQDEGFDVDQSVKVDDGSNVKTVETVLVNVHASGETGSGNPDQTEPVEVNVVEANEIHNAPSTGAAGPSQGVGNASSLSFDEADHKVQHWLEKCGDNEFLGIIIEFPEELLKSNWMPGTVPDYGPHKRPFRFPAWARPQTFFDIATTSNGHPWGDRNHHVMGPSVMHALSRKLVSSRSYVMLQMVITGEVVTCYCEDDKVIRSTQVHASVDFANVNAGPNLVVVSRQYAPQKNFFIGNHFSRMFRGVKSLKVIGLYHVNSLCDLLSHFQRDQAIELDLMDIQFVKVGSLRRLCESLPKLSKLKFNSLGTDSPHGLDVMTHIQKAVNCLLLRCESITVIVATVTVPAALKLYLHELQKCVTKEVTLYLVQSMDSAVYCELVKIGFNYEGIETRMPISQPMDFGVFSYNHNGVDMFVLSPFL